MDFVEPIRERKKITQVKNFLSGAGRQRDLLLFVVGINTALRVSDLLTLRIGDFVDTQGTIREGSIIREEKRGKRNVITVNASIREALETYLAVFPGIEKDPTHFVFFSTKRADTDFSRPITRERAWQVIS